MHRYHINVVWSDEDGSWIADVPDLRYCSAHGATAEEAVREVQIAVAAWLQSVRDHGDPIPAPRYRLQSAAWAEGGMKIIRDHGLTQGEG